jgi:hypothetical protein
MATTRRWLVASCFVSSSFYFGSHDPKSDHAGIWRDMPSDRGPACQGKSVESWPMRYQSIEYQVSDGTCSRMCVCAWRVVEPSACRAAFQNAVPKENETSTHCKTKNPTTLASRFVDGTDNNDGRIFRGPGQVMMVEIGAVECLHYRYEIEMPAIRRR